MRTDTLRLRPLRPEDEAVVRAAQLALGQEVFTFALGLEPELGWADYLTRLEHNRRGIDLPDGMVASTFLAAVVDGEIVGRTSIRHELTDSLRRDGGHIGYAVIREHRRRGYGRAILRQSIVIARRLGIERILVTCDDSNIGSAKIIESCGGALDSVVARADGRPTRRYWID
ncbi:GNAT family N-acetyltransferase [Nocardia arthritidis]|nr:GNAT family N-acetyltransferase [Nocardia arthritidis]